ncbi:hypothetical protein [Streptomyces sp. NPDC050988]|uniref:hypothetical protein n=1 Tax=Streptomyces sp. NPDC050988 TaxID=3365637 RepID=UPI0037B509A1
MGSDELMGTAERHGTAGTGVAEATEARRGPQAPDHDIPADIPVRAAERRSLTGAETETRAEAVMSAEAEAAMKAGAEAAMEAEAEAEEQGYYRQLWVEEPATRRRLPDPVRASAVRAVIIIAVTLIQAMVAFLCTLAGSWLAFPMVLSSVASTVVATWGALDVWVTRQVWNQRNGVVSVPSSTARALRRERRRARRQERASERAKERIRRQGGGAGQLSHS